MADMQSSEEEAKRLVDCYANLILRLSYTYLKSTYDAEDMSQNVLIKLLTGSYSFQNAEHEKAWVIRTTVNACKDMLRSGYRRTTVNLEAATNEPAVEPLSSAILDEVMELPEKYREAIYLHYYEGYSLQEIAEITGRSRAAVAAHLSRGRTKLRGVLEGAHGE